MEKSKNKVAQIIKGIAIVIYVLFALVGFIVIGQTVAITLVIWVRGFLSGTMMLGFAEIINLLDEIKENTKK